LSFVKVRCLRLGFFLLVRVISDGALCRVEIKLAIIPSLESSDFEAKSVGSRGIEIENLPEVENDSMFLICPDNDGRYIV
jgi:hypothetical protein